MGGERVRGASELALIQEKQHDHNDIFEKNEWCSTQEVLCVHHGHREFDFYSRIINVCRSVSQG
jgi:hypothetical protein